MSSRGRGKCVEVHPGKEAIVRFDPDRTFTCVDRCTWCCHHGVLLYQADLFELADHADVTAATTEINGRSVVKREAKSRAEHVDVDGAACAFLNGSGSCTLQDETGWKPTRCWVFPLEVTREDGDIVVDIRDDAERNCEGLDEAAERLIDHLDAFLPPLLWDLEEPDTHVDL